MLQLHVKGIDGKTHTVNLEGGDPLVSDTETIAAKLLTHINLYSIRSNRE